MASYEVRIRFRAAGGKNGTELVVPASPTGHFSSSPLEVTNGDTIVFTSALSGGTISGLSIFSDNSDVVLANTSSSVTRTVTGTSLQADTISVTTGSTLDIFLERQLAENPTDITFGADPGTFSNQVLITATGVGGAAGTLQVSENNSTWVTNGSSFTFTRNTAKTIYARVLKAGNVPTGSYSEAHTVAYLDPDLTGITAIPDIQGNLSSADTNDVVFTIGGGAAPARYRIRRTIPAGTDLGNTGDLTGSNTTGTVTLHYSSQNTTDLPAAGSVYEYIVEGQITTANGGNNTYQSTNKTIQIRRLTGNIYGFEYYNEEGKEVIGHDTNLGQFYAFGTASMPANTTTLDISITGLSNSGLFHVYLTETNGENLALNSSSHTWGGTFLTNTLRVTVSASRTYARSFRYAVIKTS